MTHSTTGERPNPDPDAGEMVLVGSAALLVAVMLFFAVGPAPKLLLAIGGYASFMSLGLLLTWTLDRRYPA